jgi:hypothetical protein
VTSGYTGSDAGRVRTLSRHATQVVQWVGLIRPRNADVLCAAWIFEGGVGDAASIQPRWYVGGPFRPCEHVKSLLPSVYIPVHTVPALDSV